MVTAVANPNDMVPSEASGTAQENVASDMVSVNQAAPAPAITSLPSVTAIMTEPAVRRAMPAIVGILTVIVFLLAYLWVQQPTYKSVYPGLSESDKQAAFDALIAGDFKPKIDEVTGDLKIPDSVYHEARIFLASRGLPQGGSTDGFDSLNNDTSMTTSQFMEQVRYTSAMEQELARSVTQIASISAARVHLASPKQSVFVRNRTPAKASVVVTPLPGRIVSASQVEAIVHLVASSIPYLAAEDVVVVNQRGKLLTDSSTFGSMQLNTVQMEYKQSLEESYRNRIEAMLIPVLGEGNVRSEVDVRIDFTQIESTFEEYDGNNNGIRPRSEILMTERGSSQLAAGVPGATSNTPPADNNVVIEGQLTGGGIAEGQGVLSEKKTRNYEIDRAVRHVKNQGGNLERVSVAVVINKLSETSQQVDNSEAEDDEAASSVIESQVIREFTALEIENFSDLVKGVVGFDAERGDTVTIVPAEFEKPQQIDMQIPWYENSSAMSGVKTLGGALTFIALLFIVVRPILRAYLPEEEVVEEIVEDLDEIKDGELTAEELNMIELGDNESLEDIKAKLKPKRSNISKDMLDTANTYDDKVALVRLLVAEDSGRVANVLKKMIKPV